LLFEQGRGRLDPHNGQTGFWEPPGREPVEVSHVVVDDCSLPALRVTQVEGDTGEGSFSVHAQFLASASAPAEVEPDSVRVEKLDPMSGAYSPTNAVVSVTPHTGEVTARIDGLEPTKHSFRIHASDAAGQASQPQRVSHWVAPRAREPADMVIYQVMVDRFRGPEGQELAPPVSPGARAGGALGGVTAAIESGELQALGVTTLWLSPVYLNPEAARLGRDDDHLYEGYHGYWVLDPRVVDPRIGGEQALRELVATAHRAGIGVLLDVVPNHVYEDSLRYTERPSDAWFNVHQAGDCVCGTATCPWSLYIQNCWFTDYLPDFRFQTPGVIDQAVADVLWWEETFDVDGVRVDAVPMMPRAVSRRIASRLRAATVATSETFVVGEVFTGGGQQGIDELRFHLGPDGLNSVFDFPLMWALREALAGSGGEGFVAVEETLEDTQAALSGSGAVLGRMIGNHDVTRFISEAAGDADADPWESPGLQPSEPEVYRRQQLALTLVMTLPGVPVVYYGDE
ncbi:MAG: alpha-amylase family glycosyl hydrolase, partial [Nannocystaceae bacterium]